jgi:phosphate transport system substrate-binding protein
LKLSRQAYLGVFLGEISNWNNAAIARANPGVDLPDTEITVIRRAEGSGTTYAFTNHLSAVGKAIGSPWTPGVGKSIVWPKKEMIGARGNAGVAALIQQTPGAIGYLEYGYADLARLEMARLENQSGSYVKPTPQTSLAALEGADLPKDYRIWIPDPGGKDAYPIITYTWVLSWKKYQDAETAEKLKDVLRFCLTQGQQYSADLGYIPLPERIAAQVLKAVDTIHGRGASIRPKKAPAWAAAADGLPLWRPESGS